MLNLNRPKSFKLRQRQAWGGSDAIAETTNPFIANLIDLPQAHLLSPLLLLSPVAPFLNRPIGID